MTTLKDILNDMLVEYRELVYREEILSSDDEEEIRRDLIKEYLDTVVNRLIDPEI